MTLGRRLAGHLLLLLACLLLTAATAAWGMRGLRQDFSLALGHYERLRQIYQVGFHLQAARAALAAEFPDLDRARLESRRATQALADTPRFAGDDGVYPRAADAVNASVVAVDAPRPSGNVFDAPLSRLNELADLLRAQIAAAQATADRRQQNTLGLLAAVAGAALLLGAWVGRRQMRAVLGPLATLSAAVRRVAAGQFDPPLSTPNADREFAALSDDFNTMARQLAAGRHALHARVEAATRALVQSERLAGVGLLAAGVAHEINNPLSIVAARVELLLGQATAAPIREPLNVVLEETFRCKRIIERLLMLSRGPTGVRATVRLDELAHSVVATVRPVAGDGRQWTIDAAPVIVSADEGELRQVLLNLLLNARQFTGDGGRVAVTVDRADGGAALAVADDGVGIDADALRRLFEPFYSTRHGDQRGTGLGLAISHAIVRAHGGRIDAHSDGPGRGSRFVVWLPTEAAA